MGIVISKLIIMAAIFGGLYFLYLLVAKPKKIEKPTTTQDIVGKKAVIDPSGIIEVDGLFRTCLYVTQVNMRTNADIEKMRVWAAFRSLLSEVGIPYTMLQLSQFLDVREYASWYEERLEKAHLTPELEESGQDVTKFIKNLDEDKTSRDYSGYVILHYNPNADNIDSGVSMGNAQLDELIRKISGKKIITKNEKRNLAKQVLTESVNVIAGYADQMGMRCWQLDKSAAYNLSYRILQKDYSTFSNVEEASDAQCFTAFHESLTKRSIQVELQEEDTHGTKAV